MRKVVTGNGLSGNITNGTTDYLYDGMQCVEERVSDAMTKQYVWGLYIDELLEINAAGTKYYPLQDMLYRTNVLTDSSGAIFEKFDYDAYGNTLIFDASDTAKSNPVCEFLFTGRRFDTESELYFYRARYYNPELGRFISRDPIGYRGGSLGLYEYCGSRSTIGIDPMGLKRWTELTATQTEEKEIYEYRNMKVTKEEFVLKSKTCYKATTSRGQVRKILAQYTVAYYTTFDDYGAAGYSYAESLAAVGLLLASLLVKKPGLKRIFGAAATTVGVGATGAAVIASMPKIVGFEAKVGNWKRLKNLTNWRPLTLVVYKKVSIKKCCP